MLDPHDGRTTMVYRISITSTVRAAALAVVAGLSVGAAVAQQGANTIEAHLAAAKAAAGFDFTGTLARVCIAPQTAPGADVPPRPPPDRATWFTEPAKVFDNLYFVGTKIHSSWALTGREGIILIDTLYDYASEEAIVGGLKKIRLGDASVTLVLTPGHTPGTVSMLFEVKDGGRPLMVAYSGGTAFNFVNDVEHFDTYIASQRKMAERADSRNATVLMSNHSEFDNAVTKIKTLAARKAGEPHPFELGREAVQRYFKVTDECAQVARLKLL